MNVNSFNKLFLKVVKSTHFPKLKYILKPLIRAAHILTKLLLNLHKKKIPPGQHNGNKSACSGKENSGTKKVAESEELDKTAPPAELAYLHCFTHLFNHAPQAS